MPRPRLRMGVGATVDVLVSKLHPKDVISKSLSTRGCFQLCETMRGKSRPSHIRLLKPFPVSLINRSREYTVKVSALIVQWKVSFRLGKVASWEKNSIVQRDFNEKPCQDLDFVWVLEPLLTSLFRSFTLRMSSVRRTQTSRRTTRPQV